MNSRSRNAVLASLARLLIENCAAIVAANRLDIAACPPDDAVILDRLKVDEDKVESMIASVLSVTAADDPAGRVISSDTREDGSHRLLGFGQ